MPVHTRVNCVEQLVSLKLAAEQAGSWQVGMVGHASATTSSSPTLRRLDRHSREAMDMLLAHREIGASLVVRASCGTERETLT